MLSKCKLKEIPTNKSQSTKLKPAIKEFADCLIQAIDDNLMKKLLTSVTYSTKPDRLSGITFSYYETQIFDSLFI